MTDSSPREKRREQLLAAASRAFAQDGYYGTSTAKVAAEAGVSQPYVIQFFGTKEALFVEVHHRAGRLVLAQLRAFASKPFDPARISAAYSGILMDRTLLLIILQGFAAASVPAIGREARSLFAEIYQVLTVEAGAGPQEARDFLANGMLLNTVLAIGMREHIDDHPWLAPMLDAIFDAE